ncbi:hypothetical protein KY284_032403 [Solanum tuberosum]|nr:hypothetical protein KY284_032403 [Solanum tuberosum]
MVNCTSEGIMFIGCPLLLVQVTRFSCGGFAIGFRVNHTMMDAYGFKMFLNALSELIQGAYVPSILPVWQRDLLNATSSPSITCTHREFDGKIESKIAWESIEYKLKEKSFFFGNTEMEGIKNQVSPNCKSTKFELLVAFLWKCRTIALDLHPGEIVRLTFFVSKHGKSLKFELPSGYYGNAFITPAAVSKAGLLCSNSLTYVVELVKKLKDHMSEEYIKSVTNLMVIKGRPELSKSWNFIVSDNRSVGFDEFDFGWGKPIFGGVSEAISYISIGIPINNEKGEKEGAKHNFKDRRPLRKSKARLSMSIAKAKTPSQKRSWLKRHVLHLSGGCLSNRTFAKARPAASENTTNSHNIERTLEIRSELRTHKSDMQINYTRRYRLNGTLKT